MYMAYILCACKRSTPTFHHQFYYICANHDSLRLINADHGMARCALKSGCGVGGNGMIKCVVNNNGIITFPVRNIYYYINGMGWDYSFFMLLDRILWGEGGSYIFHPFPFPPLPPFSPSTLANLGKYRM